MFEINTGNIIDTIWNIDDLAGRASSVSEQVKSVSYNLSGMSSMYRAGIIRALDAGAADIGAWSGRMSAAGDSLECVCRLYSNTEEILQGQSPGLQPVTVVSDQNVQSVPEAETMNAWDRFWETVTDGVVEEGTLNLIAGILEGSGRAAGLINMLTAKAFMPGAAGFYLLNESVLPFTSWLTKISPQLATAGKYGIPILGGILDFALQVHDGEDGLHAGIKAVTHTGVGVGIGALVGAIVGSIVPVAGTAAGAAVGTVAGLLVEVAISAVGTIYVNSVFDDFYDEYLREPIDQAVDWVGDRMNDLGEGISNLAEDVVEGIGNFFSGAGRMIGTIFG